MLRSGNQFDLTMFDFILKPVCTKKGELLWPIARKKNVIIPRLANSVTVYVFNLIHDYKFHGDLKRA